MSSSVSSIGSTQSGAFTPVSVAPATSGGTGFSAAVAPSTASAPTALVHNPRIIDDPSAGIITEYLSSNGSQIISQTPNAVTVAYLRQGLAADGLTKQQEQLVGSVTA